MWWGTKRASSSNRPPQVQDREPRRGTPWPARMPTRSPPGQARPHERPTNRHPVLDQLGRPGGEAAGAAPGPARHAGLRPRRRDEHGGGGLAGGADRATRPGRRLDRAGGGGVRAAGPGRRGPARPARAPVPRRAAGRGGRRAAGGGAGPGRDPGRGRAAEPGRVRGVARGLVAVTRVGERRSVHPGRGAAPGRGPGDRQCAAVHVHAGGGGGRPGPGRRPDRAGRSGLGDRRRRGQLRRAGGELLGGRPSASRPGPDPRGVAAAPTWRPVAGAPSSASPGCSG